MKITPDEVADYLLNKGPHTTDEIQANFAVTQTWASANIALAKKARLIYIKEWRAPVRRGRPKPVFAVRTSGDEVDAVPVPKPRARVVKQDDEGAPVVVRSAGLDPQHVERAAGKGLWGALSS